MLNALYWVTSHITFADGTPMDDKYFKKLIDKGLAFDAPEK